jgi:hypothetical protein
MKKTFLLCLFLCLATSAFAYSPRLWMGTYYLSGGNSFWFGGGYQGEVIIQPQGDNFNVVWRVGYSQTQVGIGILHGDNLSVAFTDLNRAGTFWGVAVFQIVGEGTLEGRWTTFDGLFQRSETLLWKGF